MWLIFVQDLFFAFPWNNFLHSVVYDVLHQILTGRIDSGLNRELTISIFRDCHLLTRILEAQKQNDIERCVISSRMGWLQSLIELSSSKVKHVRLGYMGHLTLISEDVIGALEHYPPDLRLVLAQYAPQPDWDDYVGGRYHETRIKDRSLLGGGKPVVTSGAVRNAGKWKVDEAEINATSSADPSSSGVNGGASELKGEFRRGNRLSRESSADFGVAASIHDEDEDSGPPQVLLFQRFLYVVTDIV